jgi:hypothetical protein
MFCIVLFYRDIVHEKQHRLHRLMPCKCFALCWIGCPKFVGNCITLFWKDGCRYWNLDSIGILYVLHGLLYRKQQVSLRLKHATLKKTSASCADSNLFLLLKI